MQTTFKKKSEIKNLLKGHLDIHFLWVPKHKNIKMISPTHQVAKRKRQVQQFPNTFSPY
jgi:hypothetical protein